MHHVSDNSPFDVSSTIFYQRDSFLGFLQLSNNDSPKKHVKLTEAAPQLLPPLLLSRLLRYGWLLFETQPA
ncbi:hypothetical protein BCR33DRAFT_711788 [Rhizoclosmatium globosum]|uniref:Uncharacterized protein n=1 Tax=Rhizoclosmatium globosum TaxID=329046 RepID=A0A1Y2D039_9FUNG|nr:hypothetical protein BCR33DRAFT_711788 [Rhizoclosmatium globosum]|eukprot:ORY52484.1 hypothetical protein BCR33DRAFT_711788 [Rhizoclosmatium globosum]